MFWYTSSISINCYFSIIIYILIRKIFYIIWYGHGAQVDTLIDIPVDADDDSLPRLPMTAQQQKGAAAQNCERGEQKDPKFRLFHHVLIVGCPAGVVNGFLTWYNSLIFYRFL